MFWASIAQAAELRIATFAAPLSRDGPGLLLRDIQKGEDDSLTAITFAIAQAAPDVLVLTDFDYDLDGLALAAFAQGFGADYPYLFARRPNAGLATGYDIDGNGWTGEARDAQGYGRFAGDGGIAILSRYPVAVDAVTDLSTMLWRDLPDAVLPQVGGAPFFRQKYKISYGFLRRRIGSCRSACPMTRWYQSWPLPRPRRYLMAPRI